MIKEIQRINSYNDYIIENVFEEKSLPHEIRNLQIQKGINLQTIIWVKSI